MKTLILMDHSPSPSSLDDIFWLFGRNYRVFQPFLCFREQLPFPEGDSPLDFLTDPGRAGSMFAHWRDVAEELVLLWIRRCKEFLVSGGHLWRER